MPVAPIGAILLFIFTEKAYHTRMFPRLVLTAVDLRMKAWETNRNPLKNLFHATHVLHFPQLIYPWAVMRDANKNHESTLR